MKRSKPRRKTAKTMAVKKNVKRSKASPSLSKVSLADIWPQERDFLMRPDRLRYVRQLIKADGCVFCRAAESAKPSFEGLLLWRSDTTMVLMNKYPYNTGHLLILPRRHEGDLRRLSDAEYQDISLMVRKASSILLEAYECAGLNIGMNHGAVAGAGIPDHLHWHIVPRWHGDTNFFPLIAETKVLPETLEQSYYKLKPLFDTL